MGSSIIPCLVVLSLLFVSSYGADCRGSLPQCPGLLNICLPDFSGETTDYVCVDLTATCTSCSTGVCFAGNCLTCPSAVCGANSGVNAAANAQLNLAFTAAFGSSSVSITSSTSISASAFVGVAADAVLTTISSTASSAHVTALALGATASAQAGVALEAGKTFWFDTIDTVAATGAIIVRYGAALNATAVRVANGLVHAVSFGYSNAASATSSATTAVYNALNLTGSAELRVTGQGTLTLPWTTVSVSVSASASIKFAGGVVVEGVLGTAGFVVGSVTRAAAKCQVKAQSSLQTSGTISGDSSASLQVYGRLTFGGGSITTSIDVQGSTSSSSPSSSSSAYSGVLLITGSSFTHSGSSIWVNGSAIIRIEQPSGSIVFTRFASCTSDSYIEAKVSSVSSLSNGDSGTILRFTASSTVRANMMCDVRLYDDTGATLTLTNSNKITSGRRLLSSDGSSTWNEDGTVTYEVDDGNAASSRHTASGIAAVAGAIVAAMVL